MRCGTALEADSRRVHVFWRTAGIETRNENLTQIRAVNRMAPEIEWRFIDNASVIEVIPKISRKNHEEDETIILSPVTT